LQTRLWALGKGAVSAIGTDRLRAAGHNMSDPAEFQLDRYKGLIAVMDWKSEKTQAGHGNENGDVDAAVIKSFHSGLKRAELMLRGSGTFLSVMHTKSFLRAMVERLNADAGSGLAKSMSVMRELPVRRMRVRPDGIGSR